MSITEIGLTKIQFSPDPRLGPAPEGLEYRPTLFAHPPLHRSLFILIREKIREWRERKSAPAVSGKPVPRLPVSEMKPWFVNLSKNLRALGNRAQAPVLSSKPYVHPQVWTDYYRQKFLSGINPNSVEEMPPNVLLEVGNEADRWRRQMTFFIAITFHGLLALLLMLSPGLWGEARRLMALNRVEALPEPELERMFLWLPPDLKSAPPVREPRVFSDQDRRAQGQAPKIDPKAPPIPYSEGNTDLPEIAGGGQLLSPAEQRPAEQGLDGQTVRPTEPGEGKPGEKAEEGLENGEEKGGAEREFPVQWNQEVASLRLNKLPKREQQSPDVMEIPYRTPGQALEETVQSLSRQGTLAPPGPGSSPNQFRNPSSSFSVGGPLILSDTRGVDFGPYLARLLFKVRQTWYMIIPQAALLGRQGTVVIVFDIMTDGGRGDTGVVRSSGFDPFDRAAYGSITGSEPFSPLPPEFTGDRLRLQFTFLYNPSRRAR